jgi:hypothetical protein
MQTLAGEPNRAAFSAPNDAVQPTRRGGSGDTIDDHIFLHQLTPSAPHRFA